MAEPFTAKRRVEMLRIANALELNNAVAWRNVAADFHDILAALTAAETEIERQRTILLTIDKSNRATIEMWRHALADTEDRAEKAETERDQLREALRDAFDDVNDVDGVTHEPHTDGYCCGCGKPWPCPRERVRALLASQDQEQP